MVILICTGLALRYTKVRFVLDVILGHQKSQVHQQAELEGNRIATKSRNLLEFQQQRQHIVRKLIQPNFGYTR